MSSIPQIVEPLNDDATGPSTPLQSAMSPNRSIPLNEAPDAALSSSRAGESSFAAAAASAALRMSALTRTSSSNSISDSPENDPKYRKYVAAIDRQLQSFDTVSEWADVIAFLSKLSKVVASFPQYDKIPNTLILTKRLAQCLNPALPAGVHVKVLEVYSVILERLGPDNLVDSLPLWTYGLVPFLQYASMTVKPAVFSIFEKFYVPLGPRLVPTLKNVVIAILPGLEEENNEYFHKAMQVMDALCKAVGTKHFYNDLWLILIMSPNLRLSCLHYLMRRLPNSPSKEDLIPYCGSNSCLTAQGLSCALSDKSLLVQRSTLDILVSFFPLRLQIFYDMSDLAIIVQSLFLVILRREISLTRRIYTWLLEDKSSTGELSMSLETRQCLSMTLKSMFYMPHNDVQEVIKPYKILISLLDKSEIGLPILQEILVDVVKSLIQHLHSKSLDSVSLLQSANILFEMIDPYLFWSTLYHAIFSASSVFLNLELLDFTLSHLKVFDEETEKMHIPYFSFALIVALLKIKVFDETFESALSTLVKLLRKIPLSVITHQENAEESTLIIQFKSSSSDELSLSLASHVQSFYSNHRIVDAQLYIPIRGESLCIFGCKLIPVLLIEVLTSTRLRNVQSFQLLSEIFFVFVSYTKSISSLSFVELHETLLRICSSSIDVSYLQISLSILIGLAAIFRDVLSDLKSSAENILCQLWLVLNNSNASQIVILMWTLESSLQYNMVDNFIARQLRSANGQLAITKFVMVWSSSEIHRAELHMSMVAILDLLESQKQEEVRLVTMWLRQSVSSWPEIVLRFIVTLLRNFPASIQKTFRLFEISFEVQAFVRPINVSIVIHILNLLLGLCRSCGTDFVQFLKMQEHQSKTVAKLVHISLKLASAPTFIDVLLSISLGFAVFELDGNAEYFKTLRFTAVSLLETLVVGCKLKSLNVLREMRMPLLSFLIRSIDQGLCDVQLKILNILHYIVVAEFQVQSTNRTLHDHVAENVPLDTLPLFLPTILAAFESPLNVTIIDSWTDFIIWTAPFLPNTIKRSVMPLMLSLIHVVETQETSGGMLTSLLPLLASLRRFMNFVLTGGLISDFSPLARSLEVTTQNLNQLHKSLFQNDSAAEIRQLMPSVLASLSKHFYSYSESLCTDSITAMIDNFIKSNDALVLESVLEIDLNKNTNFANHILRCFANPLKVVSLLVDVVNQKVNPGKSKKLLPHSKVTSICAISFLEAFVTDGQKMSIQVEAWSIVSTLARDSLNNTAVYRTLFAPLLRLQTRLLLSLYLAEDKRSRIDLYQKLIDAAIQVASRGADNKRRILAQKPSLSGDEFSVEAEESISFDIMNCLQEWVVPNVKEILVDQDRILNTFGNMVYYLTTPFVKLGTSGGNLYSASLKLLVAISQLPLVSKIWKRDFWDIFIDPKPIAASHDDLFHWQKCTQAIVSNEKERILDILNLDRIVCTTTTQIIFSSRDSEMVARAAMIRRLALLIFLGEQDQYLPFVPNLQEKIVELFRLPRGLAHVEVYFLLTVLLLRFTHRHLANFWPTVVTELMSLFSDHLNDAKVTDQTDEALVLLASCRFLEVLFLIGDADVQPFFWLFITESAIQLDSTFREPVSMLDRLASKWSGKKILEVELENRLFLTPLPPLAETSNRLLAFASGASARFLQRIVSNNSFHRKIDETLISIEFIDP